MFVVQIASQQAKHADFIIVNFNFKTFNNTVMSLIDMLVLLLPQIFKWMDFLGFYSNMNFY